MSEELKPCPFCGGEAEGASSRGAYPGPQAGGTVFVECTNCYASGPAEPRGNQFGITWNSRVTDEATRIATAEACARIAEERMPAVQCMSVADIVAACEDIATAIRLQQGSGKP